MSTLIVRPGYGPCPRCGSVPIQDTHVCPVGAPQVDDAESFELWNAARQVVGLPEGGMTYVHVSSEDIRRTQELAWDEGHYGSTHENPYRKED